MPRYTTTEVIILQFRPRTFRTVSADTGTVRNGNVIHYHKCIGRKKDHNGCRQHPIKKEDLEKIVLDTTVEELSNTRIDFS